MSETDTSDDTSKDRTMYVLRGTCIWSLRTGPTVYDIVPLVLLK